MKRKALLNKTVSTGLMAALFMSALSFAAAPKMVACAEEPEDPQKVYTTVELADGNLAISAYTGEEENVRIPSTINGKKVTEIIGFSNKGVTSVTLPSSVTAIRSLAFDGCKRLNSLSLTGSSVKEIEDAIIQDTAITNFYIPSTLKTLSDFAFDGASKLESISVDSGNSNFSAESGVLYDGKKKRLYYYPVARKSQYYRTPETLSAIGAGAVANNSVLTKVFISKSCISIGQDAFKNCTALTELTLAEGVKTIGTDAFAGCNALSKVYAPASLTSVSSGAISSNNPYKVIFAGTREQWWAIKDGFANSSVELSDGTDGIVSLKEDDVKIGGFKKKLVFKGTDSENQQNLIIKLKDGTKLTLNEDYTTTYKKIDRPGKVVMTIDFIGNYKGSIKKTYKTVIKPIKLKKIEISGDYVTVTTTKNKNADGYIIYFKNTKNNKITTKESYSNEASQTLKKGTYKVYAKAYVENNEKMRYSKSTPISEIVIK